MRLQIQHPTHIQNLAQYILDNKVQVNSVHVDLENLDLHDPLAQDMLLMLLESEEWPVAVPEEKIADLNSEDDKEARADAILDVLLPDTGFSGKKFLDCGCGEGHVVAAATFRGSSYSMGYDLESSNWENKNNLTTNFSEVESQKPFDIILLYDVLDHVVNEEPWKLLERIKGVLAPNGRIYIRCHPYTSKHGTHLYRTLNKAYAHLIFPNKKGIPTVPVLRPLNTYSSWFAKAGLVEYHRQLQIEELPPFFSRNGLIAEALKQIWKNDSDEWVHKPGSQQSIMGVQFVDYVLRF